MDLANSDVEGQRVGLLRVVRPNTDVEHVKDRVGTFASELIGSELVPTRTRSISSATSRAPLTPSPPSCPAAFRRRFSPFAVAAYSLSG